MSLSLIFVWFALGLHAQEISTLHSNVRALGMGDAYTAIADDESALFYNPAGLAAVRGLNIKLIGVRGGVSNLDTIKKLSKLKSASGSDYADQLNGLYGKPIWSGVGAEGSITLPLLGAAVFDHAGATVRVDNPVSPAVATNVINDFGYAAGVALPVTPFMQMGVVFKTIKRTGANLPFGAAFLADLDPKTIYNYVNVWGRGYALDLGWNLRAPVGLGSWILSAAWHNVGQTRFATGQTGPVIPFDDNNFVLATGLDLRLPGLSIRPAVDFNYVTNSALPWARKLNFGIEVGLPIVDIRAGFHEGYYTYGAGMDLGLFRVDAATYGAELGAYPGQIEDRRYVLEISVGLGVGNFGYAMANSSTAPDGESDSMGRGRGRLKVRR